MAVEERLEWTILVLDMLFVKLKDPPKCVKVPGLPENIVPVYPMTTNIDAMREVPHRSHPS